MIGIFQKCDFTPFEKIFYQKIECDEKYLFSKNLKKIDKFASFLDLFEFNDEKFEFHNFDNKVLFEVIKHG